MYQIEIENTVETHTLDEQTQEMVEKSQEIINLEELALITAKENEVQAKVDAYKAKQAHQLQHGGPGPVAEFEIMKIVNEHNGQFEVVFKQD